MTLRRRSLRVILSLLLLTAFVLPTLPTAAALPLETANVAPANNTYQTLPFAQDWSNTSLITVNDDWSAVPGVLGYLGDYLPSSSPTAVDPQTIITDTTFTAIDVIANQTNPSTLTSGGVAEFEIANPVVALQGSGTADAPFLLFHINTTGLSSIQVQYNLRDVDGSIDNAIQPVALHYRVGTSGDFTNVPAAFVADATTGPSLATLVTPINVMLPAAADNQPQVQLRVITSNAVGSDEWVGVDDFSVTAGPPATNPDLAAIKTGPAAAAPGEEIVYDLQANNIGTGAAAGVTISDTLPAGFGYVSFSSSTAVTLTDSTPPSLAWDAGDIAAGAGVTIALHVTTAGTGTVTNTMEITTTTAGDPAGNNSSSWETTVGAPELVVDKQAPAVGVIGESLTYTLIVNNQGSADAANVTVTDTLPISTTYVSDDSGVTPTNPSAGVYVWNLGTLAAAGSRTFHVTAATDAGIANATNLINQMTASTTTPGDNQAGNSDQATTGMYRLVSIYDIQFVPNPALNGDSPYTNQTVWTEGIVTAEPGEIDNISPNRTMVIEMPGGGPWSGLQIFKSAGIPAAPAGTHVRVLGLIKEYFNMTEMDMGAGANAFQIISSGNPVPVPAATTTGSLITAASAEQWESVLIEFHDAAVVNPALGSGEWSFDDGSGVTRADDLGNKDGDMTYVPAATDRYHFIRGVGWFSFSNYKLQPRYNPDIGLDVDKPTISKNAPVLVAPGGLFTYTVTVKNELGYPLTGLVIQDTVPAATTFAYALDGGSESGGVVTWNVASLAYLSTVNVRFAVTATASVTTVINSSYSISATNFVTPTYGAPLATVVDSAMHISAIQGGRHLSLLNGRTVSGVSGIVTALRSDGFNLQEPVIMEDSDPATSEGIFVRTGSAPTVLVGQSVLVNGKVEEFRPDTNNLTITRLINPTVTVQSSGNPLPAAIIIGSGGRQPPTQIIEDDASNVETDGVFDPDNDGIDFYEALEGMLVQVNDAVAVGATTAFGEIAVLVDGGAGASLRTPRGGIVIQANDFNPERVILDDVITPNPPDVLVGDSFPGAIVGVLDYGFGNFKLLNTAPLPSPLSGGLTPESTTITRTDDQITLATFNVENLDPTDPPAKFAALANQIVTNLAAPDILAVEEVQDSDGPANTSVVEASVTWGLLISAIQTAGGPTYDFRNVDPVDDQDGGEPGGNIRVGFLFRADRGIAFVDRPGATSTTANGVVMGGSGAQLNYSPGRIDPNNAAFNSSRKPLAAEFTFNGHTLFLIVNHFNSKSGDDPLFGFAQPPVLVSEVQRNQQAQIVNDFVDAILALDPSANIVALGDFNDFQFSTPLAILKGGVLTDLITGLPAAEQYSYVYDGNSQVLDHILISNHLLTPNEAGFALFDVVHANAEFPPAARATDHDPSLVRFTLEATPANVTLTNLTAGPLTSPLGWLALAGLLALAAVVMRRRGVERGE